MKRRTAGIIIVVTAIGFLAFSIRLSPPIQRMVFRSRIHRLFPADGPPSQPNFIVTAVTEFDSPDIVFDVIWDMAMSPHSSIAEQNATWICLVKCGRGKESLRKGTRYSQEDWNRAFEDSLEKQRSSAKAGNARAKTFVEELEKQRKMTYEDSKK
jgi:hypothetical protein